MKHVCDNYGCDGKRVDIDPDMFSAEDVCGELESLGLMMEDYEDVAEFVGIDADEIGVGYNI